MTFNEKLKKLIENFSDSREDRLIPKELSSELELALFVAQNEEFILSTVMLSDLIQEQYRFPKRSDYGS